MSGVGLGSASAAGSPSASLASVGLASATGAGSSVSARYLVGLAVLLVLNWIALAVMVYLYVDSDHERRKTDEARRAYEQRVTELTEGHQATASAALKLHRVYDEFKQQAAQLALTAETRQREYEQFLARRRAAAWETENIKHHPHFVVPPPPCPAASEFHKAPRSQPSGSAQPPGSARSSESASSTQTAPAGRDDPLRGDPVLCIVTPTYWRTSGVSLEYLRRTWDCVRQQSYARWQWYVIGDCYERRDELARFIETEVNDPRVQYHNLAEPGERGKVPPEQLWCCGGATANNTGMDWLLRDGHEWYVHLDDDDEWSPDHLRRLLDGLRSAPGVTCAYTQAQYAVCPFPPHYVDDISHQHPPQPGATIHSALCFSLKAHLGLRYASPCAVPGDAHLLARLVAEPGFKSAFVPAVTVFHTQEQNAQFQNGLFVNVQKLAVSAHGVQLEGFLQAMGDHRLRQVPYGTKLLTFNPLEASAYPLPTLSLTGACVENAGDSPDDLYLGHTSQGALALAADEVATGELGPAESAAAQLESLVRALLPGSPLRFIAPSAWRTLLEQALARLQVKGVTARLFAQLQNPPPSRFYLFQPHKVFQPVTAPRPTSSSRVTFTGPRRTETAATGPATVPATAREPSREPSREPATNTTSRSELEVESGSRGIEDSDQLPWVCLEGRT